MRRIVLLALLLGLLPAAKAQVGAVTGFCDQGGVSALVQGLSSTNRLQGIIPSCTVTAYLTGTQTLATIYSSASQVPLTNPFTATALNSVAPGQWTFYAATTACYDIVLSGGIQPNVYRQPVTIISQCGAGGGGGGPSLLLAHNGTPLGNQTYLNFNDVGPPPPTNNTNCTWQSDGAGDLSCYIPTQTSSVSQLLAGTCISLSPSDGLGTVTITNTCSPSAGITPVQVVLSTTLIAANTCTTQTPVTMTGVTAPSGTTPGSVFAVVPEGNPGAVNGWGATGGLVMQVWATANTLNYSLCNQSGNSITPGALTVDVSAGSGGGGGGGSGTVTSFAAPSGSWPSWLVPTVGNSTSTPSLTVTAGLIPTSALTNNTITLGTTNVVLGNTIASAAGFQSATTLAFAATPTPCGAANAAAGVDIHGNSVGCFVPSGGGGGGGGPVLQQNSSNLLNQALLNLTNTSTVSFTNSSGGVVLATVPTSAVGALGVSSPDNTTIRAVTGVYSLISTGASTVGGFNGSNIWSAYSAGAGISLAGNQISNTSPANAVMTGLTAGIIPEATGVTTLGPSGLTVLGGSTIIGSGTTANVDGFGILAVSGTSVSYTFANTYGVHPVCGGAIEGTTPGIAFEVSYTGTTSVTYTFSSSFTGNFDYLCNRRT